MSALCYYYWHVSCLKAYCCHYQQQHYDQHFKPAHVCFNILLNTQQVKRMFTLASRWGNVTIKCSVSLALSSETCRTSFVVGRRLVGPRPTGYSPVAACLTLQTIISIRLVSCRSSNANHQNTHPVFYQRLVCCITVVTAHHYKINHDKHLHTESREYRSQSQNTK